MSDRRARVLIVGPRAARSLAGALSASRHDVETSPGACDAIYEIDRAAGRSHDVIFCDVAQVDVHLSGPEFWAFLSISREAAAARVVFLETGPLSREAHASLDGIPNLHLRMPVDADALDALLCRRVAAAKSSRRAL
jgi:hypothetical protein